MYTDTSKDFNNINNQYILQKVEKTRFEKSILT